MEFNHVSVLLHEAVDGLNIKPDGIYVDGTLGGGGHSLEIAKRLNKGGHLYGIDRDTDAIEAATERLKDYSDRFSAVHGNFYNAAEIPVSYTHLRLADKGRSSGSYGRCKNNR